MGLLLQPLWPGPLLEEFERSAVGSSSQGAALSCSVCGGGLFYFGDCSLPPSTLPLPASSGTWLLAQSGWGGVARGALSAPHPPAPAARGAPLVGLDSRCRCQAGAWVETQLPAGSRGQSTALWAPLAHPPGHNKRNSLRSVPVCVLTFGRRPPCTQPGGRCSRGLGPCALSPPRCPRPPALRAGARVQEKEHPDRKGH